MIALLQSHSIFPLAVLAAAAAMVPPPAAQASPCGGSPCPVYVPHATAIPAQPPGPSWVFRKGTYTHDPFTGARVAQFEPIPPVEPLDDQRIVTSRYRRSRTNLRGADGSVDTYYEVQQWGNGRGGLDAEWERFHDAWKESYLTGGYYSQTPYVGGPPYGWSGYGYGGGWGWPGAGLPVYGYPGGGHPGYGLPPTGHGGGWGGAPPYGNPGGGPPGHAD